MRDVEGLLPAKPVERLRIYAWSPNDPPVEYAGLLKVGQTTKADVNARIRESQGQMQQAYTLHVDELAERGDGSVFRDSDVRQRLIDKGFENPIFGSAREWMRCTPDDVCTAITELRTGLKLSGTHHETFPMRPEQASAVDKAKGYFESIWAEESQAVPRFLWNAKMRFGKTFASYQLAKRLGAKRILVVTFKPAVEDAWQTDLESHADFDGWQYLSSATGGSPDDADKARPLVYFGSFQDLLGRDRRTGLIKSKNEWVHTTNWDLVIFDEYHFGAWRESAKELFEGEDERVKQKELAAEYHDGLVTFDEELDELGNDEDDFLPITTRAYLYLSGTPFKALATGEFIEEQIFNWTYTDEQRAKAEYAVAHPGAWNPYGALPEMRLFTYQMPDELIAVANQGEFDEFDLNEFFEAKGIGKDAEFTCPRRWTPCEWAPARRFRTPTSGSCLTSSTRSGSYPTLLPARQCRTCSRRSRTCSGMTTRSSSSRVPERALGWMLSRQCGRRSETATTPRRSPSRAANSPRASPSSSGPRS
jgi:hypothetical protein